MPGSRRGLPALLAAALLAACGGGGGSSPAPSAADPSGGCGVARERQFVLDTARDWYLFLELLPPAVDPTQFATADELLNALTAQARAEQKDRYFSYLTSASAEQEFLAAGAAVGFGINIGVDETGTRLLVTQVHEGSPAHQAGFARGDEILAIGSSAASLEPVSAILSRPDGLNGALGPVQSGVTRVFRMRTLDDATVERTVAKQPFTLTPVLPVTLIPRQGLTPVGYINFRTFISTADAPLREAFATLQAQSVRDVIIDLRYNGGGLVATAELLANLLAADDVDAVLYRTKLNARHTVQEQTVRVRLAAESIPALNIAFLVTGSTASASELVINSLAPHANVGVIGSPTYGKPVGQFAFDLSGCDSRLRLVTFKSVNADGYGDYFTGLPPDPPDARYRAAFCAAPDDIAHAQGDAAESMTAEALHWIDTGVCRPSAVTSSKAQVTHSGGLKPPPLPPRPTPVQVYQPGAL